MLDDCCRNIQTTALRCTFVQGISFLRAFVSYAIDKGLLRILHNTLNPAFSLPLDVILHNGAILTQGCRLDAWLPCFSRPSGCSQKGIVIGIPLPTYLTIKSLFAVERRSEVGIPLPKDNGCRGRQGRCALRRQYKSGSWPSFPFDPMVCRLHYSTISPSSLPLLYHYLHRLFYFLPTTAFILTTNLNMSRTHQEPTSSITQITIPKDITSRHDVLGRISPICLLRLLPRPPPILHLPSRAPQPHPNRVPRPLDAGRRPHPRLLPALPAEEPPERGLRLAAGRRRSRGGAGGGAEGRRVGAGAGGRREGGEGAGADALGSRRAVCAAGGFRRSALGWRESAVER